MLPSKLLVPHKNEAIEVISLKAKRGKRTVRPKAKSKSKSASVRGKIVVTAADRKAGEWFAKLVALQAKLCGPNGCPWDREQTHESLRKYLVEETYEVLDAMDSGDPRKFAGELGDLLLQITFHSYLADKAGKFDASDVIESIHSKMVRRHPHVFGDATAETSAAVLKNWEQIKANERAAEGKTQVADSVLGGVPKNLPAVLEAYQLTRRASHVGFDWENLQGVLEKLNEERREFEAVANEMAAEGKGAKLAARREEEVGDLLFAAVNVARHAGIDPEIALKKANQKFKRRFQQMETAATTSGKRFADLPRDEKENLWNAAK